MKQNTQLLKYLLCGVILLVAWSCAHWEDELPIDNHSQRELTFETLIEGSADSRIEFVDEPGKKKLSLDWSREGERFTLLNTEGGLYSSVFTQISGTNKFRGTIPGKEGTDVLCYDVTAIYPELKMEGSVLSYDISEQSGDLESKNIVMLGYAASPSGESGVLLDENAVIKFGNIVSLLKPTFKFNGESINADIKSIKIELPKRATSLMSIDAMYGTVQKTNYINITRETPSENIYISLLGTIADTLLDDEAAVAPILKNEILIFSIVTTDDTKYLGRLIANKDLEFSKIYTATVPIRKVEPGFVWYNGIEPSLPETILATGDGSEQNPFCIYTANDLQLLMDCVHYPEAVAEAYGEEMAEYIATAHYKLTHDLTIDSTDSAPWTPIGRSMSTPFRGTFDGDGHFIDGEMVYNGEQAGSDVCSLFGFFGVSCGTIKNLNITADLRTVKIDHLYLGGGFMGEDNLSGVSVGSVAGVVYNGNVLNCSNSGKVNCDYYFPLPATDNGVIGVVACVGGIAGVVASDEFTSVDAMPMISGCTNMGDVILADHTAERGVNLIAPVGGICGWQMSAGVTDCVNEGDIYGADACQIIEGTTNHNISWNIVAGISGWAVNDANLILHCVNRGNVYGGDAAFEVKGLQMTTAAGLCGSLEGVMAYDCINYGKVTEGVGGEDLGYFPRWDDEKNKEGDWPESNESQSTRAAANTMCVGMTSIGLKELIELSRNRTRFEFKIQVKEQTTYANVVFLNEGFVCSCCKNANGDTGYLTRWSTPIGDTSTFPECFIDMNLTCPGTH